MRPVLQPIMRQFRVPFFHKNIRLAADAYTGQQWYFVTLCTEKRRPVFSSSEHSFWLIEILREKSALMQFSVYAYCIMPDHFHMLVYGLSASSNLLAFVKRLKQTSGYEFRRRSGHELWQKKFHDHILRNDEPVHSVAAYIWMNPVRKGLCEDPTAYAYSGSFVLDWKQAPKPSTPWAPGKRPA